MVLYGASAGAEAALLLASYLPQLADGVVASSPTAVITPGIGVEPGPAWMFGGQPLAPGTDIPVTRIRVPLLMGDGGQDIIWDSAAAASTIMGELRGSADHAPVANLYYPGAGHYYFGFPRTSRSSPARSWAAARKPTPWPPSSSGPACSPSSTSSPPARLDEQRSPWTSPTPPAASRPNRFGRPLRRRC